MYMRMLASAAALGVCGAALADVTVTTVNEKDGKPYSATYISGGKVRVENFHGDPSFALWTQGSNQMFVVMPGRKSYIAYDKEQVKAQLKQAAEQLKQMEAQLAALPPQFREMAKKNIPGAGGKPMVNMKVTKTGQSAQKGSYTCQLVSLSIDAGGGMMTSGEDFCVVAPEKLGVPAGDLATMRAMAEFTRDMTKDLGQVVGGMPDIMEMGGWPVWGAEKPSGESWRVDIVKQGAVPGDKFQIPAGYKQEQLPSMGGPPKR